MHLWDRQCSLVFLHITQALKTLCYWLTHLATSRLWQEFHAYLVETHGEDWREALQAHKGALAQGCFPMTGKNTRGSIKDKNNKPVYNELAKDVNVGADAISCFSDADWWVWKSGLALFFWPWPEGEQRQGARDGMPIWILSRLPRYQSLARLSAPEKKHLILKKLQKILDCGYVRIAPTPSASFVACLQWNVIWVE